MHMQNIKPAPQTAAINLADSISQNLGIMHFLANASTDEVGARVGMEVGMDVGTLVGVAVGAAVGSELGVEVGIEEG